MEQQLLEFYWAMKRIRMVETVIADNYNNDIREMHTPIHLYDGQEAVAVGVCSSLNKSDMVFSNHRCHGHYLAKGGNLNKMMAELHNKAEGCCRGRGGSMHLMDKESGVALSSSIVAGNVSIGTGYAMAQQMRGIQDVSVVFFGDGASEEGSVYESICFAKLKKLPVVYVCENNLYSVATPLDRREPNQDVSSKFATILPVRKVDGNDVVEVYKAAKELIALARNGEGPGFLECITYRLRDHHNVGNGVDGRFRTEDEVRRWKEDCPIERIRKKMLEEDFIKEETLNQIEQDIQQEIEKAFSFARNSECPDVNELDAGLWG